MRIMKPEVSLRSKEGIAQILGTALIYAALTCVLREPLQMAQGMEFRVSSFVPVMAGMLFGLPGAVGSALGNVLGDSMMQELMMVRFFGAAGNFFLSYIPYRVWYGYHAEGATLYISDSATFRKFVLIMFVVALNFAIYIRALVSTFYDVSSIIPIELVFFNNFLFPMLVALPLVLFLRPYLPVIYYPQAPVGRAARFHYQLWAGFWMTFFNLIYLFSVVVLDAGLTFDWCIVLLDCVLAGYIATLPSRYVPSERERANYYSLSSMLTLCLVGGAGVMVLLLGIVAATCNFSGINEWKDPSTWLKFYEYLTIGFLVVFILMYLFLCRIESDVVKRLTDIGLGAYAYVANGKLEENEFGRNFELKSLPKYNEIDMLEHTLNRMSRRIRQYFVDMAAATQEKENMRGQMAVFTKLQRSVLPQVAEVNATLKDYWVDGEMVSAKFVGGDVYDCFFVKDDYLVIMIADVSGKGASASRMMMVSQALIRNNASLMHPSEIVAKTNETLLQNNEDTLFVTMWLGVVELSTGKITYTNAGHNPPMLRKNGSILWLKDISGPVLGLMEDMEYKEFTCQIEKGDALLLYTDGFNEAEDDSGGFFGNERLQRSFEKARLPVDIIRDVSDFVNGAEQSDDMTYFWLERRK